MSQQDEKGAGARQPRSQAESGWVGRDWDGTLGNRDFILGGGDWRGRPRKRLEDGREAERGSHSRLSRRREEARAGAGSVARWAPREQRWFPGGQVSFSGAQEDGEDRQVPMMSRSPPGVLVPCLCETIVGRRFTAPRPPKRTGSRRAMVLSTCSLSPGPRLSNQPRLTAVVPFLNFHWATWPPFLT